MRNLTSCLTATFLAVVASTSAAAQETDWSVDAELDLAVRTVASNFDLRDDDSEINGDAIAFLAVPSIAATKGPVSARLRNSTYRIEYFQDDYSDRWRFVTGFEVEYETDPNGSLAAFAEHGDNLATAEAPNTDQLELGAKVERRIGDEHRLRVEASWRERGYKDLAETEGTGPELRTEYRYRFGANHYLYVRGRLEEIDSDTARRQFDRQVISFAYQRPLARDFRIRPELAFWHTDFPGRLLPQDGYRSDDVVIPELTFLYSPGEWLFSLEGRYLTRNSTDPFFDRDGYRIALEARYEF